MININLAVAQQSIPILNSTSRLQHYSSLAYLLECPKFVIDKNPKTEEEIDNVFNYVLNNTNEFIHNIEQETIFLNPFMIAISYIHKMMHTPREDHLCLTDNRFGNILFARNIDKIMEELQNARLLDTSCIAGLPFLTDEKSYRGAHYDHFIQVGARCIGAEERSDETLEMDMLKGSAYFVARQYVAFAIHHKFTLFPKQSAEFNRVYTISFYRPDPFEICSDVTVTTRTFDMLQSVGKTIQSLFITWAAPTKSERESTTILVCLGMKEYRIDKLLYILACALRAERYLIEFLFYMQDCTTSEQDTTKIMVDEEKWKKAGGSADERKSILTLKNTGRWTIAVTFIGTAKYVPDDILVGRMYSMTVPIPDNGSNDRLSIEVIENENCSVGLYQFCEHLILDLLPKLVGVQLPAPAPPVQRQDPPYIGAPKPDPDRRFL